MLAAMRARNLTMLCANPDLVVHRGRRLVYCAGALAQAYEALGGDGRSITASRICRCIGAALAAAGNPKRPLAVGDGLVTDVRGANAAGLPVLFIADGVHGEEVVPLYCRTSGGPVRAVRDRRPGRDARAEMVRR